MTLEKPLDAVGFNNAATIINVIFSSIYYELTSRDYGCRLNLIQLNLVSNAVSKGGSFGLEWAGPGSNVMPNMYFRELKNGPAGRFLST